MNVSRAVRSGVGLLFLLSTARASQNPSGVQLFLEKCSICHREGNTVHAPSPEALHDLSEERVLQALETGVMRAQGLQLTEAERMAIAQFLARTESSALKVHAGYCQGDPQPLANRPGWPEWGVDIGNTRFVPASTARLKRATVPRLKLKWAFGFRGAWATFGQPTVFGGRIFAGSEDGHVYSLDAKTGCIYWVYKDPATVKTAISIGLGGRVAFFGDVNGDLSSVNASTGKLIWKVHADEHPVARITGSPVLFDDRLYVPVSSGEEGAAINPKYPCCTFRGKLVVLDALTGKRIWKVYTIPDAAQPTGRKNSAGVPLWGPSGASVWSVPAIDPEGRAVYIATGNSYSDPASCFSDAVMAFDIDTGKKLWSRQLTANDIWNTACVAPDKANCPPNPGNDFDFAAAPILRTLPNGRRLLIASQKSGAVYALDPDDRGRIVWESRIGKGGPLGGVQWGGAADPKRVYVPVSDWRPNSPTAGGGLLALQLTTGEKVWYAPPPKPACVNTVGCSAAQSAPVTLIPGVVFSGSEDGTLRAYDTRTGKVIWQYNDLRTFQTVNGVAARGGSMDATGPAIVNGMLYVDSGYTNEISGNVLLAFSVDGE
jgi:polyvinyl alcohol dehydrogenase (cytochrome)